MFKIDVFFVSETTCSGQQQQSGGENAILHGQLESHILSHSIVRVSKLLRGHSTNSNNMSFFTGCLDNQACAYYLYI